MVEYESLHESSASVLMQSALKGSGYAEHDAETIANHLLTAELWGKVGLSRIRPLLEDPQINRAPVSPLIMPRSNATMFLDGNGHCGIAVCQPAMVEARDRAREQGTFLLAINNHKYSGALSVYAAASAHQGLGTIVLSSATPSAGLIGVVPYGSQDGLLSTNPIAIALPSSSGHPFVLDMGTSLSSGGDVLEAFEHGDTLPGPFGLDNGGSPTADPSRILKHGALLPWADEFGSGLSTMISLLCLHADSMTGVSRSNGASAVFWSLIFDPGSVLDPASFNQRVSTWLQAVRESQPTPGMDEVRTPFDGATKRQTSNNGMISIPVPLVELLSSYSKEA